MSILSRTQFCLCFDVGNLSTYDICRISLLISHLSYTTYMDTQVFLYFLLVTLLDLLLSSFSSPFVKDQGQEGPLGISPLPQTVGTFPGARRLECTNVLLTCVVTDEETTNNAFCWGRNGVCPCTCIQWSLNDLSWCTLLCVLQLYCLKHNASYISTNHILIVTLVP